MEPATSVSPLVLDSESRLILDKIDLLKEVRGKGFPVRGMRLVDSYGQDIERLQQDRFHSEQYFPYHMTISHAEFSTILNNGLRHYPSVDMMTGAELVEVDATGRRVQAVARGVETDERHVIRSQYLLACDGKESFVRRALDIEIREFGGRESWFVAETYADDVLHSRDFLGVLV